MRADLKEKIFKYNKEIKEKSDKATDLDIIVQQISKLPHGQLKKVLTDDVLSVLEKYGYVE